MLVAAVIAGLVILRHPWSGSGADGPPGGGLEQAVSSVAVASASRQDVPITLTSLGTATSLATVTVKSQISGYLTAIRFREGQAIAKGDLIAEVDPRPYEAALAQYEGQLEKDRALLDNARLDLQRYQRLIKQDSTSKQTVDTAAATVRQYEGTVQTDQALVDTQKLNLAYCRIASPVGGRIGLRQVDLGNYVTPSDSSGIAVVTQLDPMSVVFTLPEDSLREVMKRLKAGAQLAVTAYDRANVEKLAEGRLETFDNQVDTTTGTVKLRALFANSDGSLFPNQFVNVRLLVDTMHDALTVPEAGVQTGTPGTFVYVAKADNTVALRKVSTGPSAAGRVAILAGLEPGEQVVVDGADYLSDGAKITIPAAAPASGQAASPARTEAR